jgi:hypothetical protein
MMGSCDDPEIILSAQGAAGKSLYVGFRKQFSGLQALCWLTRRAGNYTTLSTIFCGTGTVAAKEGRASSRALIAANAG